MERHITLKKFKIDQNYRLDVCEKKDNSHFLALGKDGSMLQNVKTGKKNLCSKGCWIMLNVDFDILILKN